MTTRHVVAANSRGHWCKRADEMIKIAQQETDATTRRAMLKLAAEYNRLADRTPKSPNDEDDMSAKGQ